MFCLYMSTKYYQNKMAEYSKSDRLITPCEVAFTMGPIAGLGAGGGWQDYGVDTGIIELA